MKTHEIIFRNEIVRFFITYAVPKGTIRCSISLPTGVTRRSFVKTHEIMLRSEILRFFDHLCSAENDISLLH